MDGQCQPLENGFNSPKGRECVCDDSYIYDENHGLCTIQACKNGLSDGLNEYQWEGKIAACRGEVSGFVANSNLCADGWKVLVFIFDFFTISKICEITPYVFTK